MSNGKEKTMTRERDYDLERVRSAARALDERPELWRDLWEALVGRDQDSAVFVNDDSEPVAVLKVMKSDETSEDLAKWFNGSQA